MDISPLSKQHRVLLAVILLTALAIRLVYLFDYASRPDWNFLTVDNNYHHHLATSIAEGNLLGDTTYFRAPFYVWCLGLMYALFGSSLWVGRLFGLAVGLVTLIFVYKLATRLFRPREGLLAAALFALCPVLIFYEGELLLESLFVLTVVICLYRAVIWEESGTNRNLILLGLALSLSAVTRPAILAAIPVVLVWLWITRSGWRSRLIGSALFGASVLALILPITARNIVVASDPVLIASQGGINWYIGNNPSADGMAAVMPEPYGFNWRISDLTQAAEKAKGRSLRPGEVSTYWFEQGNAWIKEHPGKFLALFARKLAMTLSPDEIPNNRDPRVAFASYAIFKYNPLQFGLIAAFGLAGLVLLWRANRAVRLPALMLAALMAGTALYFMNGRFRLPVVPLFLMTGSWFALHLVSLDVRAHRQRVTAIFLLFGSWAVLQTLHLPVSGQPDTYRYVTEGMYAYAQNDFRGAVNLYRQLRQTDSTFPELNLNLGVAYLRLGKPDSARLYLLEEIKFHPLRSKGFTNLATTALLSGDIAGAREYIAKALQLRPHDIVANRLAIRVAAANTLTAADSLPLVAEDAAARTRQYLSVLNEAAAALLTLNLTTEAERFLRRAVEATPPPIEIDDAAFDFEFPHGEKAFSREKAKSYHLLAGLAASRNDIPAVISNEQFALAGDSALVPAYHNLAMALRAMGRAAEADQVSRLAERFATGK